MADRRLRWEENVPGKYYVDQSCIGSKLCVAVAPANFRMSETGHAYVYKQPETPEEEEACREALLGCPVDAIGNGEGWRAGRPQLTTRQVGFSEWTVESGR